MKPRPAAADEAEGNRPSGALPPRVLDTREAAQILNIGPRLLRRLRADGSGPVFVRLSARSIGYLPADLVAWLAACRQHRSKGAGAHQYRTLHEPAAAAAKSGDLSCCASR